MRENKEKTFILPVIVLFVLYLLFTVADLSTSAQSGYRGADRSGAHRYLLMVTGFLIVYLPFNVRDLKIRQPVSSLIALMVWTAYVNFINNVSIWGLLIQGNMSVLWVLSYIFFETARSREEKDKSFVRKMIFILAAFYAVATIYYFFDIMMRKDRIPVLNVVYYGMALLPWLFINSSKKTKAVITVIALVVVVFSMKRGAIIALPLMILANYFVQGKIENSNKNMLKLVLVIILFFVAIMIADNLTGGFLAERFSGEEMESGSGRSEQIELITRLLGEKDFVDLFIGSGCEKSVQIIGTGIHNEWLNFLYCYGIIGFIVYAVLIIGFIRKSFYVLKTVPELAPACFMMTALYLVLSMVSTGYGGYVGFWLFGFWGYVNAEIEHRTKKSGEETQYEIVQ